MFGIHVVYIRNVYHIHIVCVMVKLLLNAALDTSTVNESTIIIQFSKQLHLGGMYSLYIGNPTFGYCGGSNWNLSERKNTDAKLHLLLTF